jgi:NAD(P)-dependent dehydrogenase (short-subunit alcohol dehydrogenase family)
MLLAGKVAIVYGAGAIGGAVARAFAREGAIVHLADQHDPSTKPVVKEIQAAGGKLETAEVNALDKDSVEKFVASVVKKSGRVDISFCATSTHVPGGEQGLKLSEITYEDFSLPIIDYTKSQFLTSNAVSKHMVKQGSGVILMITAIPSHMPFPYTAGFGPAWAAIEALCRTLAVELGPHGVRTVYLHSAGSPDAAKESFDKNETKREEFVERRKEWDRLGSTRNLLQKWPTLEQVGDMAAFMASDKAGVTTGTGVNINGGMIND